MFFLYLKEVYNNAQRNKQNLYNCLILYCVCLYGIDNEMIGDIIYTLPVIQRVYKAFGSAGQLTDGSSFT